MSSEEGFKTSHTAMDIWSFYLLSQKICYLIHFLTISMSFFFSVNKTNLAAVDCRCLFTVKFSKTELLI